MRFPTIVWAAVALLADYGLGDNYPQPLVIPASEYFEGNDGPWSTFDVRVGNPGQDVRVLVSTAAPQTLVPLADAACSTSVFSTMPSDCAVSRGNLFNPNQSSTWRDYGLYGINQNGVGLEANLGYSARVEYGFDRVAIGLTGPGLDNQTVGELAYPEPFYLGIFGLNNQPMNFTSLGNETTPSFLTTLKDQNLIPSLSWSYTAGAQYRLKQVYGQLIFSGYDTSRFTENQVTFSMAEDITRDLVVALQSISYSGANSVTLLNESINIFIDSTDPNIWLPDAACDAFEQAFGLNLDSDSGLYLINDTHHTDLLNSNAQVTFRLSDVKTGGDTVSIVLPYAAFDKTAKNPLVDNSSYYFPLKRAANSTQYTLGRTFLQEAYLSVDYERKVFNVSACAWNAGAEQNIVAIASKDSSSSSGNDGSSNGSSSSSLSGGAIAGIVVGSVLAGLLVIALITYVILRKRRKWMAAGYAVAAPKKSEPDDSVLEGPVFNDNPFSSTSNTATTRNGSGNTESPLAIASTGRSTADHSSSAGTGSSPGNGRAGAVPVAVPTGAVAGELDGRGLRPSTEIDGNEIPTHKSDGGIRRPVAQNPGVYELPGTEVGEGSQRVSREADMDRTHSPLGDLPGREGRMDDDYSPPSPFISTIGSEWGQDDRMEGLSPASTYRGSRPF